MRKLLALILIFSTVIFCATAIADPWYVSGNLGVATLNDSDINSSLFNGNASFDTGYALGGEIGRSFGKLRLGGEMAYRNNDYDAVETSPSVGVDGSISSFALMLNSYYDFKNTSVLTPFIMGGVGVADISTDRITNGNNTIPSDDSWQFAWQLGAGVGWELAEAWTLDLTYKYFATADPSFGDVGMEYGSHNVLVGLRFAF